MRVQNGPGAPSLHDLEMEQRFSRRTEPGATERFSARIDLEYVLWSESTFVQRTGRDREPQRMAPKHGAEIAARSEYPGAVIVSPAQVSDLARCCEEARIRHANKLASKNESAPCQARSFGLQICNLKSAI